ncbi:MAG: acyl-[acyl-carrier-protein]--UDP-N-acetylglucosamine O-acyltransferase, partial [Candidatus Baltobacteraceae bacterium]
KYVGERAFTRIGARTVVREYVSIQRATGAGEVTSVGADCLLLAYVHIAHNCVVGDNVTMSNLAQLAGHCLISDHAVLSGMAGVVQFTRVGRYAFVGGDSKV